MRVLQFLIQFRVLRFRWLQDFTGSTFLSELVFFLFVFFVLFSNILQSNTILVLRLLSFIGILWTSFGFFYLLLFIIGVAFYFLSFLIVRIFYNFKVNFFVVKNFLNTFVDFIVHADVAKPWQLGFQDPATPTMQGIIRFHHDMIFLLILIVVFVGWLMFRCYFHFNETKSPVAVQIVHGSVIEVVWTIIPAFILMIIAVPSFALLYSADELIEPALTLKVVGHQWYWSYEFADYANDSGDTVNFDAYIIPEDELSQGDLRLLEVDNRVVLPERTHIRVIITAADVLHCWAIPAAGIKLDACPGRLNQTSLFFKRQGTF